MALADYLQEKEPQGRPLEQIARDIDALDAQIEELGRRKSALIAEHDEAAGRVRQTPWII